MSNLLITGVPKSGKTTLAKQSGLKVKSTDDLIPLGWSEASEAVSYLFNQKTAYAAEPVALEGVAIPRALRKWLSKNPVGRPTDTIIFLSNPKVPLTKDQLSMAKGIKTVWKEIEPELKRRGVNIKYA